MLRIHFTAQDLARTTIAHEPDPLWEILLSLHMVQSGGGELTFGRWRRSVKASVNRADMLLLRELTPAMGYSPDFLTPVNAGPRFDEALDRMLSTPRAVVCEELAHLATRQQPTAWTKALAEGGSGTMRRLGQAMSSYHDAVMAPYWRAIRRHVLADRARRVEQLVTHGVERVLSDLHQRVFWDPPVLKILDFIDIDIHLGGRGLLLQPSFFCWQAPTKLADSDLPPMLVYPTPQPPGALSVPDDPDASRSPLESLLGRTRAQALEATVAGCTTSDLARSCGISLAAASQQATVLRDAALITTRRYGAAVRHEITSLGLSLLNGADVSQPA